MINPPLPPHEELRIVELASYQLQNPDTEPDFDQLSLLMSQYFNCPIALITVMDSNQQWFKGKTGTTETGNSRELSFCRHTILQDEVMVVEDASIDPRFFDNPFVTGEFNIRFYAGAPILSEDGFKLGTVCIYDTKKRKLSKANRKALLLFAKQATQLLTLRKKNIQLHQHASEIIDFKSEAFARYIHSQEADKKDIAYNLHEDFAQGIAASLLFLQLLQGEDQAQTALLNKAVAQLKDVLHKIRELSYHVSPPFPEWLYSDQLLKNFIEKKSIDLPCVVDVTVTGNSQQCSNKTTLSALRIIEQWLQLIARKKTSDQLQIDIVYDEKLELIFQNGDRSASLETLQKEVAESILTTTAHALGGSVELAFAASGLYQLSVRLPLKF